MPVPTMGLPFAADRPWNQVALKFQFAAGRMYFFVTFLKMTFVSQVFQLKIVLVNRNFVQTNVV
jgi:hypothetical protein